MERIKKFQKILFKAQSYKRSLIFILTSSFLFGFLLAFFDAIPRYKNPILDTFFFALTLFLVPSVIYSIVLNLSLNKFYKDRAFLLSLINQLLIFSSIIISLGTNRLVVSIFGILYSINLFSITGTEGRNGLIPLLFPLIYFLPIFFFLDYFMIFNLSYIFYLSILGLGIALMGSIHLTEYFFNLNIPEISAVEMISSFINDDIAIVNTGTYIDTIIQKLNFNNENGSFKVIIPWLHPGPVKGIGGGSMSTEVIKSVNKNSKGFFWHFPSSHEDDPVDPEINQRILKKEGKYISNNKSTYMLKTTSGKFTIYGQRFNDFYLFILEGRRKDDYDSTIFHEIRNLFDKDVIFVDTHNHAPFSDVDPNLVYGEGEAIRLKEAVFSLKERLDSDKLKQFKVGSHFSEGNDFFVLTLSIGKEKYMILTMDCNGISLKLTQKLNDFKKDQNYDEMLFLTTDAHDVTDFIIKEKNITSELIKLAMESSEKNMSKANVDFMQEELEDVKVLKNDWHRIFASLNYMLHFFPISLIVIFIIFFYLTFNLPL
ncbi:MAG: DUF2070 family protein [Candidatus Woesearchaeota archaeon]